MSGFYNVCVLVICILALSATLTEDFACFFLSSMANVRAKLAKTRHCPHSSQLAVICVFYINRSVLCIVCVQMCTVLYCTVLYCTALYCTLLYCTALYCTVLYCTLLHCTLLHFTLLYCTALYCTVLYCTALYCTALYCTVLLPPGVNQIAVHNITHITILQTTDLSLSTVS